MAPNDNGEERPGDKASSHEWTEGELNRWFHNDFGGRLELSHLITGTHPATSELGDGDLLQEYLKELLGENLPSTMEGPLSRNVWGWMNHQAKERFRRVWEEQFLGSESAVDELSAIVVDMPGPGALPGLPDDEAPGQIDQELGDGLVLPEGWEDLEPMEDTTIREAITDRIEPTDELVEGGLVPPEGWEDLEPMEDTTIRKAITDRIESTGEQVEADLPGLADDGTPGEIDQVLIDEMQQELDEAASEIPLYVPPDSEPASDIPQVPQAPPKRSPRKLLAWILGGFGIVGVIVVGLLSFASSDPAPQSDTVAALEEVDGSASPTEAVVSDQPPPTELAAANVSSAAFPGLWIFTATKTASIVPAPEFIGATPIGAVLPWSVAVTEICDGGGACTYTSVIQPLIPESVLSEVPEAVWVVDGPEWSLDVTWLSTQSFFGDGTVCVIEKRWTYQFTVTAAELIEGRSIATAFEGTWVQEDRLDLSASTGDLSLCGESWQLVDEWTVVGSASR